MIVFRYIYYRMYNAYRAKNDSPFFRTFMYMTLLMFFIIGSFLIYLEKLMTVGNVLSITTINNIKQSYFFWGVVILCVFWLTYINFFRLNIDEYERMFSKYNALNKAIKIWMLIALPFFLFFLSIYVYILLFGGHVFGKEVIGVFPG